MGAKITGAGGPTITIQGVPRLHGVSNYPVIPDRIEAGTFLIAAAITGSSMRIEPVIPSTSTLFCKTAGLRMSPDIDNQSITITPGPLQRLTSQPNFSRDFPPTSSPVHGPDDPARGTSIIREKIYENRLQHVAELQRMGASIR